VTPTRWTIVEAGEEVSGPIRALDLASTDEVNHVRSSWYHTLRRKPERSGYVLMSDALGGQRQGKPDPTYRNDFWAAHAERRETLLRRAEVRLATSPSGHTFIGWACVEPWRGYVHYVHVTKEFRRHGIARQLLADMLDRKDVLYTNRTYDGDSCPLPQGWRFSALRML